MIARFARPRVLVASFSISSEARAQILLAGLSAVVVVGFTLSLLAPMIWSDAFSRLDISPSDLTPFMNSW